jgi:LysR family transcriptional regulator, hydrogen peroxide-inducible genes activator
MNLRDLEYFSAVAELGHFGKAAQRCFCTQSTLSGQLRKLEEELGTPLLERLQGGGVRLTPLGEQALPAARSALGAVRRITDLGRAAHDPLEGTLVLAAIPTIGPWLWPTALPGLREAFPKLEILLREEQTSRQLQSLREGAVDLGILALPSETTGLETLELWEEPFLLAVPERHPMASAPTLTVSDLDGAELLLLEEGHCLRDQALDVCHRGGAREREGFRATSLESLLEMVRAGLGITLLPASAARAGEGLVLRSFEDPPVRTVGIAWRPTHPRACAFPQIAGALRDARPF